MPFVEKRKSASSRQISTDGLAIWTYIAAAYSLLAYGAGIIYCTWALTEDGLPTHAQMVFNTDVWHTIWSFDLVMYGVGMFCTVVMMIGLLWASRLSLLPWVLVSCVICAKQFTQLLAVIAFAEKGISVVMSSIEFAIALIQVVFIFIVLIKYDQIGRIMRQKEQRHAMRVLAASQSHHPKAMLIPPSAAGSPMLHQKMALPWTTDPYCTYYGYPNAYPTYPYY